MLKRQTLLNAIMSVFQFVVVGANFFILYQFLLRSLGVETLGLWSVVVAATSMTGAANLGLAGGVVKFVAQYAARGNHKRIVELIETAFLSMGLILGFVLVLLYPIIQYALRHILPETALKQSQLILPFVILSFWVKTLGQIFQSGIEGFQRIDMRSIFLMVNNDIYGFVYFSCDKIWANGPCVCLSDS
jgi:O-antigen/teichoic acid export membrane protein